MLLVKRKVVYTNSTVGPRHDPYGRDTWGILQVYEDGTELDIDWIECGLAGVELEVNGDRMHAGDDPKKIAELAELFEDLVGVNPYFLQRAYWALHADDEPDPMGCLADYE